ncbi:MAG: hypothetical protein CMH57_05860 [Myxococcales bacterium]|nr:hypothetical protein [Myxococcales bacterium]
MDIQLISAGSAASDGSGAKACLPFALIGCAGAGVVIMMAVAGVVAWLLLNDTPVPSLPDKDEVEVVKYAKIKHRKTGPSTTKPSGKSGQEMTLPQGVIRRSAKEVVLSDAIHFEQDPDYCKNLDRFTDIAKNILFDLDREMRDSTRLSVQEEEALGDQIAAEVRKSAPFKGKLDTPRTARWRKYLARVAQPLLAEIERKELTYHFHVVDEPVVNAFAMPGGHIYFYTGLLENKNGTWAENEAHVATIMAHEISHIDLGHTTVLFQYLKQAGILGSGAQGIAQAAIYFARHPFSSNQEAESDENGVKLMYWAQYSPEEAVALWKLWARQQKSDKNANDPISKELENLLRSHPDPRRRACDLMKHANAVMANGQFERFYVGETNLRKRKARTQRQY